MFTGSITATSTASAGNAPAEPSDAETHPLSIALEILQGGGSLLPPTYPPKTNDLTKHRLLFLCKHTKKKKGARRERREADKNWNNKKIKK